MLILILTHGQTRLALHCANQANQSMLDVFIEDLQRFNIPIQDFGAAAVVANETNPGLENHSCFPNMADKQAQQFVLRCLFTEDFDVFVDDIRLFLLAANKKVESNLK